MENYKEKHKSHMATCHSPFADVYKQQSINGDDEEKTIRRIRLHAILHLQMCISINPLMETMKKNNKVYTATCHSSFADVQKWQSINGDDEKTIRHIRLHVILHLQMCISSNPLMETMKKNNQAYTATCHSPFADVYKYQSVNGDDEEKQ